MIRSLRTWSVCTVGGCTIVGVGVACSTFGDADPDPPITTTTADGSASSLEASSDTGVTSDVGVPNGTKGPRCGSVRCSSGQTCCFNDAGLNGTCVATAEDCLGGRPFRCSGKESCAGQAQGPTEKKCCASYLGAEQLGESVCAFSCKEPASLRELCEVDEAPNACPPLRGCVPMPGGYEPASFSECVAIVSPGKDAGSD